MERRLGLRAVGCIGPAGRSSPAIAGRRCGVGLVSDLWLAAGDGRGRRNVRACRSLPVTTAPWIHWEPTSTSTSRVTATRCNAASWRTDLEAWCGNAGWFPAYPWLIRAVAAVGVDHATVALTLSWLFSLATVVLIWAEFCPRVDAVAAAVVLFAAFAPGLIYVYAAFPLSMLAFLTVLYFVFLRRGNWASAGIVGCVLVLTYPVGFAAPLAAALGLFVAYREITLAERLRRIALAVLPSAGALALLPVVQQEQPATGTHIFWPRRTSDTGSPTPWPGRSRRCGCSSI